MSVRQPYPGLRAFTPDEADLFFGREDCVNDMVDRLAATRFLAVLGASGSGKSSLVRTGLFDALQLGLLAKAGAHWTIADIKHPGGDPMRHLTSALLRTVKPQPSTAEVQEMEAFFRRGPRSVIKWAEANVPKGTSLLLLVDQFEELFRYDDYAQREEVETFVAQLLESASWPNGSIYVVMTMRSEYLGACASIAGLAERISSGLYLTPRMSREECQMAIEGPASVIGFCVEPKLVNQLLNDLASFAPWVDQEGDLATQLSRQADQLPLMQHVLNRLWLRAELDENGRKVLKLAEYESLGGLSGALDMHGAEVRAALSERAQAKVEPVFRALVTGGSLAAAVRRRCRLGELITVGGGDRDAVIEIIEAFRSEDCNFLSTTEKSLEDDTVRVDISHESLIRQWTPLREWLNKEIEDDAAWRRLISEQELYRRKQGNLLSGLNYQTSERWWQTSQPTAVWAARHGGRFEEVSAFLEESREAEEKKIEAERQTQLRERRRLIATVGGLAVGLVVVTFSAVRSHRLSVRAGNLSQQVQQTLSDMVKVNGQLTQMNGQLTQSRSEAEAGQEEAIFTTAQQYAAQARRDLDSSLEKSPRKAMMWLRKAVDQLHQATQVERKYAKNDPGNDPKDDQVGNPEDAKLSQMFSEALFETKGQRAFMGGAQGHEGAIDAAWFSPPDGRLVLTQGDDNKVKVWDGKNGAPQRTIPLPASGVSSAKLSPDGRWLVATTQDQDGLAIVYSVADGTPVVIFHNASPVYDAAVDDSGTLLATATQDGILRVWEIRPRENRKAQKPPEVWSPLYKLTSPEAETAVIYRVAFVPGASNKTLIAVEDTPANSRDKSSTNTGKVRLWNYETGKQSTPVPASTSFITDLQTDGHGTFLVVDGDGVQIWNPNTGAHYWLEDAGRVNHAAISHNGRWVVTSTGRDATLWDVSSGTSRYTLHGHTDHINDLSFNKDDSLVVTGGDDGTAKVWSVAGGQLLASLETPGKLNVAQFSPSEPNVVVTGSTDKTAILWDWSKVYRSADSITHSKPVNDVLFSSKDTMAVTASNDGTAVIYDLIHHKVLRKLSEPQGSIREAEFSPDGTLVVTAPGKGKEARIWSVATGRLLYSLRHDDAVYAVHFSPDGRWVVTVGEDHTARVWEAKSGRSVLVITAQDAKGGKHHVYDAHFSPDSNELAVGSENNTAEVWNIPRKQKLFVLQHNDWVYRVNFGTDGRILTASRDGTAKVWDGKTGRLEFALTCTMCFNPVLDAHFSRDGRYIATSGEKGEANLWDGHSGRLLSPLNGGQGTIYSAEFNADGTLVATASNDGTVDVWNLVPVVDAKTKSINVDALEIATIEEHPSTNQAIFAHNDPLLLAVASEDGRASFWKIPHGKHSIDQLYDEASVFYPDPETERLWEQELPTTFSSQGHKEPGGTTPNKANKSEEPKYIPSQ